jgi:hypothetical protein
MVNTFPDLVEAVCARPPTTVEEDPELGWRGADDER